MLTFHPRFSKNVHIRDWPVVLPPHGPVDINKIHYHPKKGIMYCIFSVNGKIRSSYILLFVFEEWPHYGVFVFYKKLALNENFGYDHFVLWNMFLYWQVFQWSFGLYLAKKLDRNNNKKQTSKYRKTSKKNKQQI